MKKGGAAAVSPFMSEMDIAQFEHLYPRTSDIFGYIAQRGDREGTARFVQRQPQYLQTVLAELEQLQTLSPMPWAAIQRLSETWFAEDDQRQAWLESIVKQLQCAAT
jgi:hypothetical protein